MYRLVSLLKAYELLEQAGESKYQLGPKAIMMGYVARSTVDLADIWRPGLERSMGPLGTAAMASMDSRLPWFRAMSAENRSWLGLVAQAALATFVDWVKHPERNRPAVAGAGSRFLSTCSLTPSTPLARCPPDPVPLPHRATPSGVLFFPDGSCS